MLFKDLINQKNKRIYLDHAATTPIAQEVKNAMERFWKIDFGNPGGIYKEGIIAKSAVDNARKEVATSLHSHYKEIVFTSGGTEANNLAIIGFANALEKSGMQLNDAHFITSVIEHPSVLNCFRELEKRGARVSYIEVFESGILDVAQLKRSLKENTVFVSIMYANNEMGTLQPIEEISKILRSHRKNTKEQIIIEGYTRTFPVFHIDVSQSILFYDINVEKLDVDYIVLDGQKIFGPKGVGALYHRNGAPLSRILFGGGQEQGFRPGTENIPAIVGFGEALHLAGDRREKDFQSLIKLRDYFIEQILSIIPKAELNGDPKKRLPNNVNISIPNIDNEWVVIQLDAKGIAAGIGSACMTNEKQGSYVIDALGKGKELSQNSLRFTLGRETTKKDLDYVVKTLGEII